MATAHAFDKPAADEITLDDIACDSTCTFCGCGVYDMQPPRERQPRQVMHAALVPLGLKGYDLCWDCWDGIADQYAADSGAWTQP
jgi:hypothetical protein